MLSGIIYCEDAYDALKGADCMAVLTEWNEFRAINLDRVKSLLKSPILVDLRNIYEPREMIDAGFHYSSIGRPGSK